MTDQNRSVSYLLTSTNKTVFTTGDLNKIWKYENYRSLIKRIGDLNKSGALIQIRKGLYTIDGLRVNELELANKVRTPSYISFETVLYKEGIIFQWDTQVTLASKESFSTLVGGTQLIYRKLKDNILLNGVGVFETDNYHIATKERAVLDMLYIDSNFHFDNLRSINFEKLQQLKSIYNSKKLNVVVKKLEGYARSY